MNRNTSIAFLLALATLASVKALDLKRHIRQPLTATRVATLTPLREEQVLTPRELVKPAERPARRAKSGAAALKDAFVDARAEGRAALIPYLTAGYPTKDETVDLLLATQAGGADVIELGVPCSNPFMDGPVIATCHDVARKQDVDLAQCLSDVMTAREQGLTVPLILMGYNGPFVEYGWKRLADDAVTAGVDGFLVPDCPSHEIDGVAAALAKHGRAFVPLVTPTTTKLDRTIDIARRTGGSMTYVISKPGKTGCSAAGVDEVAPRMDEVRRAAGDVPTTIGFGVSTPDHVRSFAPLADGVVVGSGLIREINKGRSPYERRTIASTFVGRLAAATRQ